MVVGGKKKHPRQQNKNPKNFQKNNNQKIKGDCPADHSARSQPNVHAEGYISEETKIADTQSHFLDLETFQNQQSSKDFNNIDPFKDLPNILIKDPNSGFLEYDHLMVTVDHQKLDELLKLEQGSAETFGFFMFNTKDDDDKCVRKTPTRRQEKSKTDQNQSTMKTDTKIMHIEKPFSDRLEFLKNQCEKFGLTDNTNVSSFNDGDSDDNSYLSDWERDDDDEINLKKGEKCSFYNLNKNYKESLLNLEEKLRNLPEKQVNTSDSVSRINIIQDEIQEKLSDLQVGNSLDLTNRNLNKVSGSEAEKLEDWLDDFL